jgi:LPS sulfotransferase NodH
VAEPPHWTPDAVAAFLADVLARGSTDNGVFGAKLMAGYAPDFHSLLDEIPDLRGLTLDEALRRTFPSLRYVWVRRRDRVRQAISLWRAIQTWTWKAGDNGAKPHPPEYHRGAVDHLVTQLGEQDAAWERFFAATPAQPLVLTYEDHLAHGVGGATAAVLSWLEVPVPPGVDLAQPPTERQADALSEAWLKRHAAPQPT